MTTLAFDTLKAAKALRAAGFDDAQAEALTEQIGVAVGENVATKNDVAAVRSDMEKLELRMTIKMYAAIAGGVGLIKALDFLIG